MIVVVSCCVSCTGVVVSCCVSCCTGVVCHAVFHVVQAWLCHAEQM